MVKTTIPSQRVTMTGAKHRTSRIGIVLALAVAAWFSATVRGEPEIQDLARQRDKQKDVRADTDHVVRRSSTMLRVLDYYKLDRSAEKRLLDEVAGTLAGLSKEQMTEVIARLGNAAKVSDARKSEQEIDVAYDRHREILIRLKELLSRYEAVKTLDQAAERLERTAKKQFELHLQTSQLVQDWPEAARGQSRNTERKSRQSILSEVRHEADEQGDLQRDVAQTLKQLADLNDLLPPDEKERLNRAEAAAMSQRLLENQTKAEAQLRSKERPDLREQNWKSATDLQRKAAADLQDLARGLRSPSDKLAALHEARERIDRALARQENLRDEAHAQQDPRMQDREKLERRDLARRSQEMGDQQARLAHDTRDAQNILKPHVQELANKITPAEKAMQQAEELLRRRAPLDAVKPQSQAAETLHDVRKDLDRLIAQAEKQRSDPLAALQKASESLDRLIKQQKDIRNKTNDAEESKQAERTQPLAAKQQDLARRTDELMQQPLPSKPQTQAALDMAARAMEKAAEALHDKNSTEALPKQDQAVKSLEEAQKHFGEQIADIEKRREELAALDDASKKLAELAQKEKYVGEQAREMAKHKEPDGTKDLAKQQGKLTPDAKEIGKQIEKSAPEAADHVAKSAKHMEAAKGKLEDRQLPSAAEQADKATSKLEDAQKALAKALDEKKGMEIADQAAMERGEVDPLNAAQQLAKAIEQTKQAANQSQKAVEQLGQKSATPKAKQPNLAKLQKQVADKANQLGLQEAGKPAEDAAKALEQGDLNNAIEEQKNALAQLQTDAKQSSEQHARAAEGTQTSAPPSAKHAGELAQSQKALLDATQALAKSHEANQGATAALEQAQAQAPSAVQPQLQKAGQQLGQASQQLSQGTPTNANQSQKEAVGQMTKAMQALNAALAAMGQPGSQSGQQSHALASAMRPGQGQKPSQGQQPSQGQAKNQKPGQSQERNQTKGTGNRVASDSPRNAPSQMQQVKGEGSFLHLPQRQRDMIIQALSGKLPPEYAAMIQQYYINVAGGKPAAKTTTPEKR